MTEHPSQPDPREAFQPAPDPGITTTPLPPLLPPEPDPDAVPRSRPFPLHPNFWWGLLWCFALVACTQVPAGIAAAAFIVIAAIIDPNSMRAGMNSPAVAMAFVFAILLAHGLIIACSLGALRIVGGRDWMRLVALRRPTLSHVLLTVAILPAFMILGSGFYALLRYLGVPSFADLGMPGGSSMEDMVKLVNDWPLPLAILTIGVFPGISEELWCRAFLGRGLVGRHGYILGVLGTSFLFGLIHVDPAQGTMAIFMGVILHLVYLASRSLLIPILLHFLNNSMAVTITRIPLIAELDSKPGDAPWHIVAAGLVLMWACLLAFWLSRARLEGVWQPRYAGVELPPEDSGTVVVTPAPPLWSVALVGVGVAAVAASLTFALKAV